MSFRGFINQRYAKFIIDDKGKRPFEKVRPTPTYSLDQLHDWNGALAMKVPDGVVVLDSDTREESEILLKCIKEKGVKCLISKSPKGYHFYFKIPEGLKIKNTADNSIPLGLVDIDYRSGQRLSWIIEYRECRWADWVPGFEPKANQKGEYSLDPYRDLDDLPYWLYPLKSNLITFRGYKEGDGRNNLLNIHRTRLVDQYKYNQEQVREVFEMINNFVFSEPLPKPELEAVATFREIDLRNSDERWFENGKFLHNVLGDYIIKLMYCYRDDRRRVWFYNDKYYSSDPYVLERKIVEICPTLTARQRKEVMDHINLADIKSNVEPQKEHSWICCNNCLVDGATGHTAGFTASIFVSNQFEVDYDAEAYDEHVDKFLNQLLVEKGDVEQRMIFEEYLGYTIFSKSNFMKKHLINIGKNAYNGKSTLFAVVQSLLTSKNFSVLSLRDIHEKNQHVIPKLVDKIANFDDEGPRILDESSVLYIKKIVSNKNEITINPKFKEPFQTCITAKLWTNTNQIIKTPQKGQEWMGRLLILSFNNIFSGKNEDQFILSKLTTPKAKSYLLNLAINGYMRLLSNKKFTLSAESEKWVKQYKIENDTVYNFLFTKKYKIEQFIGKDLLLKAVYQEYKNDCEENDIKSMNMDNFSQRFLEYFNNKLKLEIVNNQWIIKEVK